MFALSPRRSRAKSTRRERTRGVAIAVVLFLLVALALLTVTMMTASQGAARLAMASAADPASLEAGQAGVQIAESMVESNRIPLVPNQMVYLAWPGSQPWVAGDAHADPYASAFLSPTAPATAFSPGAIAFPSTAQNLVSTNFPGLQWVRIWPEVVPGSANSFRFVSLPASSGGTQLYQMFQAAAYVKRGLSTRMVVKELAWSYPSFPQMNPAPASSNPLVPAALTLVGNSPTYLDPHSNNWTVSGFDLSNPNAPPVVALGGSSDNGASSLQSQAFRPDYTHYPGANATSSSSNPSIINTISAGVMSPFLSTIGGLQQFVAQIRSMANLVCTSAGCPSSAGDGTGFLDASQPRITVIDGDYTLPANGGGILLVTGTLTVPNNFHWDGLLLVVGSGIIQFTNNGGGAPLVRGAIFGANPCANLSGAAPQPNLSDCSQMGSAGFKGSSTGNGGFNGGGNGGIYYDSALISQDLFASQVAASSSSGNGSGGGSTTAGTPTWQAMSLSQFTPPN